MKRQIDLAQKFKTFEGKNYQHEGKDFTLKDALMVYIRAASQMGLSESDQSTAYVLGFLIGKEEGKVTLTTAQYDCIKRMADSGQTSNREGTNEIWVSIEVKLQIKEMVDAAESIKEKDDDKTT
jgi:hypothetical protein